MKRIILCLDGTWNNSQTRSAITNVYKLHQAIPTSDGNGVQQISHYIEGIASAEGEWLQFLKGGIGYGVGDRIRKAYQTIVRDYEAGDEIYLVGFSRGAFEARSLGGLITLFGVAKPEGAFSLDKAWSLYRKGEKRRDQVALAELRAAAHYPAPIKCVAVWDTVGNLGNPFFSSGAIARRHKFHDIRLSTIEVGLHALSVDEVRGPFRPMLWTVPKGQVLPANQHVEQVWFAGTHADVGGGHRETALSDVALLWMAERLQAKTGLAVDMHELGHATRPDPLGAQHSVTQGRIFFWSGLLPFIRLVRQAVEAIPPVRRALIGTWRAGKLPSDVEAVNESIHDSVLERFGQGVIELRHGRSRVMTYRPANLIPVVPEHGVLTAKAKTGEPRRIKIFTVHGTFAHDTDWDDWDRADDEKKQQRAFINQLAAHLKQQGLALEELDHTQYNWSGGNSHDERRVAAIGLKKLIQQDLSKAYEAHGKDYYDKVFIIAHSHGGTISRLAMNLWDKDDDYYDPVKSPGIDEFKLDDRCPTCLRSRNGLVGRNTVRRPDGVITFGSPFVTFEPRGAGLFTARLSAWVFRILAAVPLATVVYLAYAFGAYGVVSTLWSYTPGFVKPLVHLVAPLALYWLTVSYPSQLLDRIERWFGKSTVLLVMSAGLQGLKYLVLGGTAVHYAAYFANKQDSILQWLPLTNTSFQISLGWSVLIAIVLLLIVALPGSFLLWLKRDVGSLRERLPTKYDPAEDRLVPYVSYHTPGDEAGLHLRVFGALTWVVQTLALSAASVLAFGIILLGAIGVEAALGFSQSGSILNRWGVSAVSDFPEFRDRFVALIDTLTYLPKIVWSDIAGSSWLPTLGGLDNRREVAWYVPIALVLAILLIFLLLMPFVVIAVAFVYLVSMWLRSTGVVFGSEKLAWNLANQITVTRHPNANTMFRVLFISPEAWWRREIAHSYYYKSRRVIEDVAKRIADWSSHRATLVLPVEAWVAAAGRALVVLLFVLSIFAVSIPIASGFASLGERLSFFVGDVFGAGPGAMPDPKTATEYIARGNAFSAKGHHDRALADASKAIELEPNNPIGYNNRGVAHQATRAHDLAIADYDKAIELAPNYALAHYNRAIVYRSKGDFDRVLADYSKAIELEPSNVRYFNSRANFYRERGDADLALADMTKAAELEPTYAHFRALGAAKYGYGRFQAATADLLRAVELKEDIYSMLFLFLARTRAGETATAELEANAGRLKSKDWPHAALELYLGKRTPAATLTAASNADERCEAHYYIGQWHTVRNNAAEAANALRITVDTCPKTFIEYQAAVEELKRGKG